MSDVRVYGNFTVRLGRTAKTSQVFYNGVELKGVTSIRIEQSVDSPTTVELSFLAVEVNGTADG